MTGKYYRDVLCTTMVAKRSPGLYKRRRMASGSGQSTPSRPSKSSKSSVDQA